MKTLKNIPDNKKRLLEIIYLTVGGNLLYAAGVDLCITPIHLYSGGFTGIAQLIRTFLLEFLHIPQIPGVDYMGIIYFSINIPFFLMAFRVMGKKFCATTLISIAMASFFLSAIPIPTEPIIHDTLLSSIVGGLGSGIGAGMVLKAGSSQGGQDLIGVCLAKTNPNFKVGTIGIIISIFIYTCCLFMYNIDTVLYSMIFAIITGLGINKVHTQNIKLEAMIFTKNDGIEQAILHEMKRGVTYWHGKGAYTQDDSKILVTVIAKYEENQLRRIIEENDPNAFVILTENATVMGNFEKRFVD